MLYYARKISLCCYCHQTQVELITIECPLYELLSYADKDNGTREESEHTTRLDKTRKNTDRFYSYFVLKTVKYVVWNPKQYTGY